MLPQSSTSFQLVNTSIVPAAVQDIAYSSATDTVYICNVPLLVNHSCRIAAAESTTGTHAVITCIDSNCSTTDDWINPAAFDGGSVSLMEVGADVLLHFAAKGPGFASAIIHQGTNCARKTHLLTPVIDPVTCATANCGAGTCSTIFGGFRCECPSTLEFNGTTCATPVPQDCDDPANGKAICHPTDS